LKKEKGGGQLRYALGDPSLHGGKFAGSLGTVEKKTMKDQVGGGLKAKGCIKGGRGGGRPSFEEEIFTGSERRKLHTTPRKLNGGKGIGEQELHTRDRGLRSIVRSIGLGPKQAKFCRRVKRGRAEGVGPAEGACKRQGHHNFTGVSMVRGGKGI